MTLRFDTSMVHHVNDSSFGRVQVKFSIPFCLDTKREKKVKAVLNSSRKLRKAQLPYPNSQTA
jgi:hypothetical protein